MAEEKWLMADGFLWLELQHSIGVGMFFPLAISHLPFFLTLGPG
jgi:hypothetical protein